MTERQRSAIAAARSLYPSHLRHNHVDFHQNHSINLFSEDFIAGFNHDGRMSVVRRFFCLFVTFDLIFISLLWIICVVITGENFYKAFQEQVINYEIHKSLFDIVLAAALRFLVLITFYAIIYCNHWIVIALSTAGSCAFLISKVFIYDWTITQQPVFQVLLIIVSFVLAWGEAWFLDCRVIPQERYASIVDTINPSSFDERSPLLAPYLNSVAPESHYNFYSPIDSFHNSDDEEEFQDDEYKQKGIETVKLAYSLLFESNDWKIEKVTTCQDTIQSLTNDFGKVYRLTGKVSYPAKELFKELFYKIENVPKWNPTLLESKIIRKIDSRTDVAYSVSVSSGGGLIKSRDFVNLRCWRLCNEGDIVENYDINAPTPDIKPEFSEVTSSSTSSVGLDNLDTGKANDRLLKKSASDNRLLNLESRKQEDISQELSKSLGAHHLNYSDDEEPFTDAQTDTLPAKQYKAGKNVFVSAAVSVDYPNAPIISKYIRGQNLISCWAMSEIAPDACIFEFALCVDLKGSIPKYVLNNAYITVLQDYITYLRTYVIQLKKP